VLLAGGATTLAVVEGTGATIWKVVDTVGAGSESVNRPVGCSYTVVVTLVVQEVLEVDDSCRVTVVVTLRVQEVLDSVALDMLVAIAKEGMVEVDAGVSSLPSGVFRGDDSGVGVELDVGAGVSLVLLDVEAGASSVVLDEGAWLEAASVALLDEEAGGAALYDVADVETAAELEVGVVDGSAVFFLAGSVPFLIMRRAWVTSKAESC
jgi:hypothetical protein